MRPALLLSVIVLFQLQLFAQSDFGGCYIAIMPLKVSEMGGMQRAFAEAKKIDTGFFRISYLKIKKDSAYLDHQIIFINNADTTVLKDDGIYKYFDGTFSIADSAINFTLKEVIVNYFEQTIIVDSGNLMEVRRRYEMNGKLTASGILIGNILFKKTNVTPKLISEKPELFKMRN